MYGETFYGRHTVKYSVKYLQKLTPKTSGIPDCMPDMVLAQAVAC